LRFEHEALGLDAHLGLDAAAAEGACGCTVREDEHRGAGLLRSAAAGADNGAQGHALAAADA
jgi:hypothetical protein